MGDLPIVVIATSYIGKIHERLQFLVHILIFQCLFLVDCQWTDWSEWSCCSQTCTEGVRTRTRNENQTAQNGGKPCLGQKVESEICHYGPCPGKILENIF